MNRQLLILLLPALMLALTQAVPEVRAANVVASMKDIKGQIDVERHNSTLTGRNGLILYDRDVVVTGQNSKATIVFRDGSVIRLFANTRFLIEGSVEEKQGSRRFLHNFMLKLGTFWGKFTKKYQKTTIRTPTATAGIKGTIVAMRQTPGSLDVSLTTGAVTLRNDREMIELKPGQIARGITDRGLISDKIKHLPYKLVFKADQPEIKIGTNGTEIYFTLQMVEKAVKRNARRSGPVYISHQYDNIHFEQDIRLNARGYARIKATVLPFKEKDRNQEPIHFTAVMDGEAFIDVDAGQTSLTVVQTGQKAKTLKIDVHSDSIE